MASIDEAVCIDIKPRYVESRTGSRQPILDPIAIDTHFAKYARASRDQRAPLLLDLRGVRYIDHDCLLYLAALVRFRSLRRLETFFTLPESRFVLEYLRAWEFPETMMIVTGKQFVSLLGDADAERFKAETADPPRYVEVMETPGGGREGMLMRRQLAITPIDVRANDVYVATIAQEAWRESQLVGILNVYLNTRGTRIADQIVREVVLNSVHHPEATMAFTSAQFGRPPSWLGASPARLQFSIWDDGLAMGETLRRAHKLGPITSDGFGAIEETFLVELIRSNGAEHLRIIDTSNAYRPTDMAAYIVSAFIAGITSRPDLRQNDQFRDEDELTVPPRAGGFGLRHLRRNVIDLFGGKIRYSTGNYRMSMWGGGEPNTYRVHVAYMPMSSWHLKGNLLIIELPFNPGTAS